MVKYSKKQKSEVVAVSNMENTQNNQEKKILVLEKIKKNPVLIAVCVAVVALIVAIIPIIIHLADEKEPPKNQDDIGITLSGSYSMSVESDMFAASSVYTFDGSGGSRTYVDDGELIVEDFTYVIALENGEKVIKFTFTDADGMTETTTHSFMEGTFVDNEHTSSDGQPIEKKFISINDVYYYLEETAE